MAKKVEVILLQPARDELVEIARKHMELVGPQSARKITDRLRDALARLGTHPRMGRAMEDRELGMPGFRRLVCGNYLCFYRILGGDVVVYHIVDGRTNYPRLFAEGVEPGEDDYAAERRRRLSDVTEEVLSENENALRELAKNEE